MEVRTLTPKKDRTEPARTKEVNNYLQTRVMPLLAPLQLELLTLRPPDLRAHCVEWLKNYHHRADDPRELFSDEQPDEVFQAKRRRMRTARRGQRKGVSGESGQEIVALVGSGEGGGAGEWSQETRAILILALKKFFLFEQLPQDRILQLLGRLRPRTVERGQVVIRQGETGQALFVVEQGRLRCERQGEFVREYRPGSVFGELALLYNHPRASTITALTPGRLFQLPRQHFNQVLRGGTLERLRECESLLSRIDFFRDLDALERSKLLQSMEERRVPAERFIIREGEVGNCFYIIAEGQLVAYKQREDGNRLVYAYKCGDYFGEIALLKNVPRQASIKTLTDARLFFIDRDSFVRVVGPLEGILSRSCERYSIWGGELSGEGDCESMRECVQ